MARGLEHDGNRVWIGGQSMVRRSDRESVAILIRAVEEVIDGHPGTIVGSTSTTFIDVDSLALAEIVLVYEDFLQTNFREGDVSNFVALWTRGATLEMISAQAIDGLKSR